VHPRFATVVVVIASLALGGCFGGYSSGASGGSPTSPSGKSGSPPVFTNGNALFQGMDPAPLVVGGSSTTYVYVNNGSAGTSVEAAPDGLTFTAIPASYPAGFSRTIVPLTDGRYRMYYFATATSIDVSSAISSDGLNWTVEAGTRYSDPNIGKIRGVALPAGGYRLYYPNGVGYSSLLSPDGLSFTAEGPVTITPSDATFSWNVAAPAYVNGQFHMVLTRTPTSTSVSELWHAVSIDGRTWTVDKSVMAADPGVPINQPAWGINGSIARIYYRAQPSGGDNVVVSAVLGL